MKHTLLPVKFPPHLWFFLCLAKAVFNLHQQPWNNNIKQWLNRIMNSFDTFHSYFTSTSEGRMMKASINCFMHAWIAFKFQIIRSSVLSYRNCSSVYDKVPTSCQLGKWRFVPLVLQDDCVFSVFTSYSCKSNVSIFDKFLMFTQLISLLYQFL